MNLYPRRARLYSGLALMTLLSLGCGESDLEELHEARLDDAVAASNSNTGNDGTPSLGAALPAELNADGYTLTFSEEFHGTELDRSKWNTALPWGPDVVINDEQQYYFDSLGDPDFSHSPFVLEDGVLTVSAIETPEALRASANEQPWLSGVLSSTGKFDFTYGYAEARVSLPTGQGVWPSFWMPATVFEELKPTLFVMERNGSVPDSIFTNYEYVDGDGVSRSPGQFEIEQAGLSDGFHTVGVSWSPEEFLFFVDGVARYRIIGENVSSQSMYLVLSLAIGGNWTGPSDESTPRPVEWSIDYVRVWQGNAVAE